MNEMIKKYYLWYLPRKKVFDKNFFEFYKKILTAKRTKREVEFIIKILRLKPGLKILDLACGWGRHAIEFAKRGYKVVGQDINYFLLQEGKKICLKENVKINWIRSDMRRIPFKNEFDVIVNLFTSFGYYEKEEDCQKVIFEIAKALKPKSYFVLDVINREKILHPYKPKRIIRTKNGDVLIIETNFDLISSRSNEQRTLILKNKKPKKFFISVRIFTLTDLISMIQKADLIFKKVYGDYSGAPFNLKSERCIIVAQKK